MNILKAHGSQKSKWQTGAQAARGKPSAHSSLELQAAGFSMTLFLKRISSELPGNFSVLHSKASAAVCFDLGIDPEHVPI